MPSRLILAVLVAICFVRCQCAVLAIDPTPVNAPGGKTPLELAQLIADEATGVVVNAATVSTTVNDPANGSPATDTRTYGDFTSGVTTLGTALPTVNGGPTATYTAGIGIDTGVCLSTGRLTDGVSEPAQGVGC